MAATTAASPPALPPSALPQGALSLRTLPALFLSGRALPPRALPANWARIKFLCLSLSSTTTPLSFLTTSRTDRRLRPCLLFLGNLTDAAATATGSSLALAATYSARRDTSYFVLFGTASCLLRIFCIGFHFIFHLFLLLFAFLLRFSIETCHASLRNFRRLSLFLLSWSNLRFCCGCCTATAAAAAPACSRLACEFGALGLPC